MRTDIVTALGQIASNGVRGNARFVSLVTSTSLKLNKKNRTTGEPCQYVQGVRRIADRRGVIGASYESAVNRQRVREESPMDENDVVQYFRAEELWKGKGEHTSIPYLVRHKDTGKLYLCFKPGQDTEGNITNGQDRYVDVANDRELSEDEVKDLKKNFLPPITPNTKQEVEQEVFWRTIAVENVKEIICGEKYQIVKPIPENTVLEDN